MVEIIIEDSIIVQDLRQIQLNILLRHLNNLVVLIETLKREDEYINLVDLDKKL
jgi:hypothetical protein